MLMQKPDNEFNQPVYILQTPLTATDIATLEVWTKEEIKSKFLSVYFNKEIGEKGTYFATSRLKYEEEINVFGN